mmetsp:Transcript_1073/g.2061  ORF Transcript_1073/g.2061 Transcript_1073/m.2061 type:complete len:167 (+) Transcript_1073:1-501(+)
MQEQIVRLSGELEETRSRLMAIEAEEANELSKMQIATMQWQAEQAARTEAESRLKAVTLELERARAEGPSLSATLPPWSTQTSARTSASSSAGVSPGLGGVAPGVSPALSGVRRHASTRGTSSSPPLRASSDVLLEQELGRITSWLRESLKEKREAHHLPSNQVYA